MERSDRVAAIPAEAGWSDVGSWAILRELLKKDARGNVLRGDVLALDSRKFSILRARSPGGRFEVGGIGGCGHGDALLVCREDLSQNVRKIAERLREQEREEALKHREVFKPWDAYKVLDQGDGYLPKWLDVLPGERVICRLGS